MVLVGEKRGGVTMHPPCEAVTSFGHWKKGSKAGACTTKKNLKKARKGGGFWGFEDYF